MKNTGGGKMKQIELSDYVYRNLRHCPFCDKCGGYIEKYHEIEYTRNRVGRRVVYKFYHKECADKR